MHCYIFFSDSSTEIWITEILLLFLNYEKLPAYYGGVAVSGIL